MNRSRRSLLSAIGMALPFGLGAGVSAVADDSTLMLGFRSFEDAAPEAFSDRNETSPCRRVEIGHFE